MFKRCNFCNEIEDAALPSRDGGFYGDEVVHMCERKRGWLDALAGSGKNPDRNDNQ